MTISFVKKFPETTQEFYKTLETAFVSVAVSFGLRQPQITLLLGGDVRDDDMKAALGKGPAVVKTLLNGTCFFLLSCESELLISNSLLHIVVAIRAHFRLMNFGVL